MRTHQSTWGGCSSLALGRAELATRCDTAPPTTHHPVAPRRPRPHTYKRKHALPHEHPPTDTRRSKIQLRMELRAPSSRARARARAPCGRSRRRVESNHSRVASRVDESRVDESPVMHACIHALTADDGPSLRLSDCDGGCEDATPIHACIASARPPHSVTREGRLRNARVE